MSAGHSSPFNTERFEEPESNHTSRMSFSLRHFVAPQEHFVPTGSNSSGVCWYHASAPSFSNHFTTLRSAAKSSRRATQASQEKTIMGTPQKRWRETHQSGRFSIISYMRSSPQAGNHFTWWASARASGRKDLAAPSA